MAVEGLYVVVVLYVQFCSQQQIHPDCFGSQIYILVYGVMVSKANQEWLVAVILLDFPYQRHNIIVCSAVVRVGIGVDM